MKSKEIWEKRDNIWKSISSCSDECVLKNECQFEVQAEELVPFQDKMLKEH